MTKIFRLSFKNLKKITRLNFQIKCFCWHVKSILNHYFIQNVKDGIQFRAHTINKDSVSLYIQFISVKVKKILRKFYENFRIDFAKSLEN